MNKEIEYDNNFKVIIECNECGRQHENKDIIHQTSYSDGTIVNIPEVENWRCPKHPTAQHSHLHSETIIESDDLR